MSSEDSVTPDIEHATNVFRTVLEDENQHIEDALRVALGVAYEAGVQHGLDLRDDLREEIAGLRARLTARDA